MAMSVGDRLRETRRASGYASATAAAKAFGWGVSTYTHHENGTRRLTSEAAERYARAFAISLDWLLTGRGAAKAGTLPQARLVGHIGAGGEVFDPETDDYEMIDALPGAPPGTEALIVKNGSMRPVYRDGDVIFVVPGTYDLARLVGVEVAAQTADGRRLLKELRRGSQPDRWTLYSFNADPIEDVAVTRVAPVWGVKKGWALK